MSKLIVFNLVTLDGYFAGKGGDISWHNVDVAFQEYAQKNSNSGNMLLFGRRTHELMANYWTSQNAFKNDPIVAKGMNNSSKIVFLEHYLMARLFPSHIVTTKLSVKRCSKYLGVVRPCCGSNFRNLFPVIKFHYSHRSSHHVEYT